MKRSHPPETPSNADEDTVKTPSEADHDEDKDKEALPRIPTRGLSPSPSPSPTPQNILDRIRTHSAIAPHYNDAQIAESTMLGGVLIVQLHSGRSTG
jgi:hypothetical protein